eukprot:c27058_g1_i2 orf=358-1629(-)
MEVEDVAVEKGVDELRREIEELNRQQREITERLRDPRGLRRGNAIGVNARPAIRSMGRGVVQRGAVRQADDFNSEEQPFTKKRLLSTVVKVEDEQSEKASQEIVTEEMAVKDKDAAEHANEHVENQRPFLQCPPNVKRDGRKGNTGFMHPDAPPTELLPRVLPKMDDPKLAKRNRRIFGALLGTLERFRQEERQLSSSEAFLRRSDSMKRAEQRAQEESEKLRQQEREILAEKRRRDLTLRARLAAKAEEKQLELLFIHWTEHHNKLYKFLRTKAEPSIFYMASKNSETFENILEKQQKDLLEWKRMRREDLTDYQGQISEEYLANVEAEIERWQAGANRRNAVNASQESIDVHEAPHQGNNQLKVIPSSEYGVDEGLEDMVDDDIVDNLLEEEEVARNDEEHEQKLKGVVEYASADDEMNDR